MEIDPPNSSSLIPAFLSVSVPMIGASSVVQEGWMELLALGKRSSSSIERWSQKQYGSALLVSLIDLV